MSALDRYDEEVVQKKEKEKEKDRREKVREERIAVQKEQYAQRLQVRGGWHACAWCGVWRRGGGGGEGPDSAVLGCDAERRQ